MTQIERDVAMRGGSVLAAPSIAGTQARGHEQPSAARRYGWLVVAAVGSVAAFDFARLAIENQPAWLSSLPHVFCLSATVLALTGRDPVRLPSYAGLAICIVLLMCGIGSGIAWSQGTSEFKIVVGWLEYGGMVAPLMAGFLASRQSLSWRLVHRFVVWLIWVTAVVVVLQQFGLLEQEVILEGTPTTRGTALGAFRHATGLFRTHAVLLTFLAFAMVVVLHGDRSTSSSEVRTALLSAVLCLCALLAGKRSGIFVVIAPLAAYLLVGRNALYAATTLVALVVGVWFIGAEGSVADETAVRIAYTTDVEAYESRAATATDLREADVALLSFGGEGLASTGFAAGAGGEFDRLKAFHLLEQHPLLHFGWFQDLYTFGYGFAWLGLLPYALFAGTFIRLARSPENMKEQSRYTGLAYLFACAVIYYFVGPSWLHAMSGSLFWGLALGVSLGRLSAAKVRT